MFLTFNLKIWNKSPYPLLNTASHITTTALNTYYDLRSEKFLFSNSQLSISFTFLVFVLLSMASRNKFDIIPLSH